MDGSAKTTDQEERFKILFDRYKKPVHDYIRTITGSHEVAEEITQIVFIRLWKKMGSYDLIENIDYYIFRIARNESMRYFKKAAVETQLSKELQTRMTSGSNNISEYINYKETEALLNKAIASLSPKRKKVYQLSRRQGLRMEEIAAEMQLSYNTVRNHLVEALRQIRKYYLKHFSTVVLLFISFISH
ncbi:MAG TPA: RNA polymerase sigma-70 factor [Puia sp.]|jgi:RNA polymerase sigma-70 factor (family 1)|nr:RNA polymerase sigma-70 factor [Puia sp.]